MTAPQSSEIISDAIADQAERLVDTRGYSYDEAYRELGFAGATALANTAAQPTPAEAAREEFRAYATREFHLTGPDTRTPDERAASAETYQKGRQAAEVALKAMRESRQSRDV